MSASERDIIWHAQDTWGTYAFAEDIEDRLQLTEVVQKLPAGATVLDIAAGPYLDMEAALYSRRPDLRFIALDTGYSFKDVRSDIEEAAVELTTYYQDDVQARLKADSSWHSRLIGANAENLPLRSASVDLIFSHAGVPHSLKLCQENYTAVFYEMARVLKLGGTAILGPYHHHIKDVWEPVVDCASKLLGFSSVDSQYKEFKVEWSRQSAFFMQLVK